jgi:hypothetical protein
MTYGRRPYAPARRGVQSKGMRTVVGSHPQVCSFGGRRLHSVQLGSDLAKWRRSARSEASARTDRRGRR